MKKILFLLLVTIASYGQTYQNPTFGTVKTKTAPTVTTAPHLGTIETDGTISKITPANLPVSTATQDSIDNGIASNAGLQNAYNFEPEIVTSAIKGAVTVQEGTGNDANNVLVGKNNAGTTNFSVKGSGDIGVKTTVLNHSDSSTFPANFKNPAGSFNIIPAINDDINLKPSGTGMVTIQDGWGLGFKPVPGLEAGPDFGANVGGIAYRPPTESMTKNFFIFRGGQYVFEDDGASWKMIITPTGVNIGGGATGVGGAIPMSLFEVNGNASIGASYDRTFSAPANGLIVEGALGVGTPNPIGKATIVTGSGLSYNPVSQEDKSVVFSNASSGVTVPVVSGKSTNGIGLSLTGINIEANPNTDMAFNSSRIDGLNFSDLTKSAFRFRTAGSTVVNLVDILRNGNTTFIGNITAPSYTGGATLTGTPTAPTPTTSTGIANKGYVDNATLTSGIITTATNITNATLTDTSLPQNGKTLYISNGATNINYTVNAGITASFVKGGTGSITFVQGSGRTMVAANGTLIFNGAQYSTASVVSFGTTDIVYINNF